MSLSLPPKDFHNTPLPVVDFSPDDLIRISGFPSGEPYFGLSGANRFDDYRTPKRTRFGTCYFGTTLAVALAETVLHDETPVRGKFEIPETVLESRLVVLFSGKPLRLANFTGAALKRLGADSSVSSLTPYRLPQRWAVALHEHPEDVDGFLYMSRHMNTEKAVVLFDRAKAKIQATSYDPLLDAKGAFRAATVLGVSPI